MNKTAISYLTHTWSPIVGCTHSGRPGCDHCWARVLHDKRHKAHVSGKKMPGQYMFPFETVQLFPERLDEPLKLKKPSRIGVCFQSDLFHERVPDYSRSAVFGRIGHALWHTFVILTKRPDLMADYVAGFTGQNFPFDKLFPNVCLGYSGSTLDDLDWGLPYLLKTPAARRVISIEPMLGPIELGSWESSRGELHFRNSMPVDQWRKVVPGLDWVILGGESGPKARPCDVNWIRSVVRQCKAASVPCFVKQLGANVVDRNDAGFEGDNPEGWPMDTRVEDLTPTGWQGEPVRIRLRDRAGADPEEWPEDLRVREFPSDGGKRCQVA